MSKKKISLSLLFILLVIVSILFVYSHKKEPSTVEKIDFTPILKRIWVIEDDEINYSSVSFIINNVTDETMTGTITLGELNVPSNKTMEDNLHCEIDEKSALCSFSDKEAEIGEVTLYLNKDSNLEGIFTFTSSYKPDNILPDEKYQFTPYNMGALLKSISLTEFELEDNTVYLKNLGDVKLYFAKNSGLDKKPVYSFMLDEDNNILYEFSNICPNNTCVNGVYFEDLNDNKLKDIIITFASPNCESNIRLSRVLFQNKDGSFYANDALSKELNNVNEVKSIDELISYIKNALK